MKLFFLFFLFFAFFCNQLFSFNRFFKFDFGARLAALVVDISDSNPNNGAQARFDFAIATTYNIWFASRTAFEIDLIFQRKGSIINDQNFLLHYISVPNLLKFYLSQDLSYAIVLGLTHNFLISASGRLKNPEIDITLSDMNKYDLGITFGLQYLFYEFDNTMKLIGDFRMEYGVINTYRNYRPELFNRVFCYVSIGLDFF